MRFYAHVQIFRTKIEKNRVAVLFCTKNCCDIKTRLSSDLLPHAFSAIVCLNSKFPPPVELCWQNINISKLGILITKVGNIIIL
jgi:hypothetical protein